MCEAPVRWVMKRPLEKARLVGLVAVVAVATVLMLLIYAISLRCSVAIGFIMSVPKKLWSGRVSIATKATMPVLEDDDDAIALPSRSSQQLHQSQFSPTRSLLLLSPLSLNLLLFELAANAEQLGRRWEVVVCTTEGAWIQTGVRGVGG
ncbi:hypothetical protein GUJ93_ZPchr2172g29114 [Zizania palustris]|uniref:Uncharacterized protein n=1 Tax=Zizania palustris TaxID=103762 RepID=A0A8J5R5F4_ZIZPA|nr:hypothetical protein GUJ93_ZPchr2172g29114 [Zizania palustris]